MCYPSGGEDEKQKNKGDFSSAEEHPQKNTPHRLVMAFNVVPPANYKSSINSHTGVQHQSNTVQSLPDTLREQKSTQPITQDINEQHSLQGHLAQYENVQRARQLEQYRDIFGIAEPTKRIMDLQIIERSDFNPLNANNLHSDIYLNKDCSVDWEDIYKTDKGLVTDVDNSNVHDTLHEAIERSVGI